VYLIVGLGNPGDDYRLSRHNIGFMVIDRLAQIHGIRVNRYKCLSLCGEGRFNGERVFLAKPRVFMNRSGHAVKKVLDFLEIDVINLLVVHDDIDLDFGRLRVVARGGHGGHKGVSSIIENVDSEDFCRIKIGIGRPRYSETVEDYVLGGFYPEESDTLPHLISRAGQAAEDIVVRGVSYAMNQFNK
jgi:PTH1 family peptidyl-tRNA hydrolase